MLGVALVPTLGATPAGASGGTVTTITGHAGTTPPSLGIPAPAASAQISPTYVARASNGDLAVAQTKGGSVYVYLVPAASEANAYNIQTAPNPSPAFGPLTAGDAYIVAGTGTAGLIAQPGNNQFGNSLTPVATANPIEPTSVAFDPAGNLLIAGASAGDSAIQVVAKTTGTFYGVSMTAGDLYTIAYVGLSGAPSTAIRMGDVAAVANGMSVDPNGNIVVGDGDGAYFVNEQTSGSLSLYGLTIQHQAAAVVAGNAQGGTDCSAGAANAAANSLYFASAAPFVDGSDNIYLNDNEIGGVNGGGCDWVLPAHSGTFDGMSVTAGNVYKLAGNGGTSATPDGTAGINANVSGTSEMTVDPAGNVVLAVQSGTGYGTSPALQILAESTCASSCPYGLSSTTAGDIYTVAGGPSNVLATLSGPTSVLSDGTGNLYFTDGATSSANLDKLTGGPTQPAAPTVTSVTPNNGPQSGTNTVTVAGSGFVSGSTTVDFGPNAGTSVNVTSGTSLSVVVPAGSGTVSVTVATTSGGTSAPLANAYTYNGSTVSGGAITLGKSTDLIGNYPEKVSGTGWAAWRHDGHAQSVRQHDLRLGDLRCGEQGERDAWDRQGGRDLQE